MLFILQIITNIDLFPGNFEMKGKYDGAENGEVKHFTRLLMWHRLTHCDCLQSFSVVQSSLASLASSV